MAFFRRLRPKSSTFFQLHVCGVPFTLNRELLSTKSAKLCRLLKENPQDDLTHLMKDIPTDPETFELVGRFCHGYEIDLSIENVIRVSCLAHYLEMTEKHCPDNLLRKSLTFIEQNIIPSWSKCINALKSMENTLHQSSSMGLVSACVGSLIEKALDEPRLLGEPIITSANDDDDSDNDVTIYRANVRRKLFASNYEYEDLTTLSLKLYEPIIRAMVQQKVPLHHITASICQYAKKWVFSNITESDDMSVYRRNSQREVIEAVARLLPHETGLLPCTLLCELLHTAVSLDASPECTNGLELRIGKQLDEATVKDLLIPTQGYAKDEKYDTECVKRILKNFYCNYNENDISGLIAVAKLIDDYLVEVASDIDLKLTSFISLTEMSVAISTGTPRTSDGLYKAIDIYLEKHRYLKESEREEACKALDCNKMSPDACQHAALNDRLPLRLVVQVLLVAQLQLRDTIVKEAHCPDNRLMRLEGDDDTERLINGIEEEAKTEIEKMGSKVLELERECCVIRREIRRGCCSNNKEKAGMWTELKRKFGCSTRNQDCNCHLKRKKVHPRFV
ncbi:hypothetical protein Leryth_023111 [Lithospermum erythrorhizon]|nr:hypothetical protein Leryth_023111 [Lithospermum erythrorhizon]